MSADMLKPRRSKRLMRNLHLGPFQQLGFTVAGKVRVGADHDELLDRFIDAVEMRGLSCGGGFEAGFFIVPTGRRWATEADRAATAKWLAVQPEIGSPVVGPLVDAWYDDEHPPPEL